MLKAYNYTGTEIKVGNEYYLKEIWDEVGEAEDILESGCVAYYDSDISDYVIIDFEIVETNDDEILNTVVRVTNIG